MIGVGGLVINNKNQVLAVMEKQSMFAGSWKLPGGYVEPGKCECNTKYIPKYIQ